jgi:putative AlgH/UPF0301 family transcriptional regulator
MRKFIFFVIPSLSKEFIVGGPLWSRNEFLLYKSPDKDHTPTLGAIRDISLEKMETIVQSMENGMLRKKVL